MTCTVDGRKPNEEWRVIGQCPKHVKQSQALAIQYYLPRNSFKEISHGEVQALDLVWSLTFVRFYPQWGKQTCFAASIALDFGFVHPLKVRAMHIRRLLWE